MAYDSPKAAHLAAYLDGELLPRLDPIGLAARWEIAHELESHGVDFLRLNAESIAIIETVCGSTAGRMIEVRPDVSLPR